MIAGDDVVCCSSRNGIVARATAENAIATFTEDSVVSGTAKQGIIANPAVQPVVAIASVDPVVAFKTSDPVVAAPSVDGIGDGGADQGVAIVTVDLSQRQIVRVPSPRREMAAIGRPIDMLCRLYVEWAEDAWIGARVAHDRVGVVVVRRGQRVRSLERVLEAERVANFVQQQVHEIGARRIDQHISADLRLGGEIRTNIDVVDGARSQQRAALG